MRVTAEGLDGDVLIATHAIEELAGIVASNEKHFDGIVDAYAWQQYRSPMQRERQFLCSFNYAVQSREGACQVR